MVGLDETRNRLHGSSWVPSTIFLGLCMLAIMLVVPKLDGSKAPPKPPRRPEALIIIDPNAPTLADALEGECQWSGAAC
jgi:hypothetical protein